MANTFIEKSKYGTLNIERAVSSSASYDDFVRKFKDELLETNVLGKCLNQLVCKYDVVVTTASELAGLSRTYFSKIINGEKTNPSRDALISICVVIGADFEETQDVLKCGGKQPLYVRNKRDIVIWFGLKKKESLGTINDNLCKHGLTPLTKNA